ncbi:Uncharacterized protein APZ42_022423 [Daphnia magna]|uniref:Homologous recombination OB-fold protein OB-fold domain-containing protein n=1 Tax=Daphnia magna TaxID=35525 RepID=A0A164VHV7_9CRUS|nr:Uncharacterized protein APZ42_022423 [Daphnia magna]
MLGNDDSDEDFNFDLDEVVKLATQQNVKETVVSNHKAKELIHTSQLPKNDTGEDWGNDDDIFDEILEAENVGEVSHSSKTSQQDHAPSILREKLVHQCATRKVLDHTINSQESMYNPQEITKNVNVHEKPVHKIMEKGAAKFPGPAGLLSLTENKPKGKETKTNLQSMGNMDGLCCWDKALSLLRLKSSWESNKMNLQMVKKTIAPTAVYLTAPLLVVGVLRIEVAPIISHDVSCVLQDPTGEVKGRILQDVITDYGKLIRVGSILVLRRPSVLQMVPSCFVTVTKKCLIGIFSSQNNEITQLQKFAKEDLITWLTEPVVYGDPVMTGEEAKEAEETPLTLFTSAASAFAATSAIRPGATASTHKPYERPSTSSNYNRPRAPVNPTPRPVMNATPRPAINRTPRLPISSTPRPSHNSIGQSSRPPTSNSNQFSYKSPSAIISTPRPAPYAPPTRSSPVPDATPTIPAQAKTCGNATDDHFLSQFLQGVDTDSLFDDF